MLPRSFVLALVAVAAFALADTPWPMFGDTEVAHAQLGSPSGAISSSPLNYDFAAGEPVADKPPNYNFESGLVNWTTEVGNAKTLSGGPTGSTSYLQLNPTGSGSFNAIVSAADTPSPGTFQISSSASVWTFYLRTFSGPATHRVEFDDQNDQTGWIQVSSGTDSSGQWVRKDIDLETWRGKTIRVRYSAASGSVGFDEGATRKLPGWTADGAPTFESNVSFPASAAAAGDGSTGTCKGGSVPASSLGAARLESNESVESDAFTIPGDATHIAFRMLGSGANSIATINLYLGSESYEEAHPLFNKEINSDSIYTVCTISTSWQTENAKISIGSSSGGTVLVSIAGFTSANLGPKWELPTDMVSPVSGAQRHVHTDIAIPAKGVPLEFSRTYVSDMRSTEGALRGGWVHNYEANMTALTSGDAMVQYPDGNQITFTNNGGTLQAPKGIYDSLVKNGDNTYTLTTRAQIKYNFSLTGKLTSIVDRNNNTTTVSYDMNGRLSTVTSPGTPNPRQLTFTPDSFGRISQVTDSLTRTVGFQYDGDGNLWKVTDVKQGVTTYTYENGRLKTITDSLTQLQLEDKYDEVGRVAERKDSVNGITCFYYGSGPAYTSAACPGVDPDPQPGEMIKVDSRGFEERQQFDKSFRTTGVEDHLGNTTLFEYDTPGGTLCSRNGSGQLADAGNRCKVTDPRGNYTKYEFDHRGNITKRTNGLDDFWTFTYTTSNDVDLETDAMSRQVDYVYDGVGNMTQIARKDSGGAIKALTCFERNSSGLTTAIVESTNLVQSPCTGNRTQFDYDVHGNLTCEVNARFSSGSPCDQIAIKSTFTYDAGNRLETAMNELRQPSGSPESGTSQCGDLGAGNDADNDGDTVKDDGCPSEKYTYDNLGNIETEVDGAGTTTTYAGTKTTYEYDVKGHLKKIFDANRATVDTAESGSQCGGTAGTGNDSDDDSDGTKDDGCPSTRMEYDAGGRLIRVIDGEGSTVTYGYDSIGNQTSVTNAKRVPVGASPESSTPGSQCGPNGTEGNGLDDDSDTVIDDGCPSMVFSYDPVNRLKSETDALANTSTFLYWPDSQLKQRLDPRGRATKYTYDAAGRLTLLEHRPNSADDSRLLDKVDYAYDDVGNRTGMTETRYVSPTEVATTSFGHDALNRLTSVTYPGPQTVGYQYDHSGSGGAPYPGQLTKITYPDSSVVTYTFKPDGTMESVTDFQNPPKTTTYAYDNAGQLDLSSQTTAGSTLTSDHGYDGAGRLLTLENKSGSTAISSYSYMLDKVGNRKQVIDSAPNPDRQTNYDYDPAYRVKEVRYPPQPGGEVQTFEYDAAGNRETKVDAQGTVNYSYNAADQLVTEGTTPYAYYKNGAVVRIGTTNVADTNNTYLLQDDEERFLRMGHCFDPNLDNTTTIQDIFKLVTLFGKSEAGDPEYDIRSDVQPDGPNGSITIEDIVRIVSQFGQSCPENVHSFYNADGLRVKRISGAPPNATPVSYVWDVSGGLPRLLSDSAGNKYVHGLDLISRTDNGGGQEYYLYDGLGSTTGLSTSSGTVTYEYDVFGALRSQAGSSANEFRFTGEQHDPTGFQYLRARYYDPRTGRFLSKDPQGALNPYLYVGNNPVNFTDPSGEFLLALAAANPGTTMAVLTAAMVAFLALRDCVDENKWSGGSCLAEIMALTRAQEAEIEALNTCGARSCDRTSGPVIPYTVYSDETGSEGTEASSSESGKPKSVEDVLKGAIKERSGRTTIYRKTGGFEQANEEFDEMARGTNVRVREGGLRTATLPNGTKITVRPNSSDGRPTLEIHPPGSKPIEIRY